MNDTPARKSTLSCALQLLPYALSLLPLIYLVYLVAKWHVDVPFFDEWTLVGTLEKSYLGTLAVSDLFRQHMEHRPFFPTLILLPLARLTAWNVTYEVALNVAIAVAIFVALALQLRGTFRSLGQLGAEWLAPVVSLMVFPLKAWQNWLWGWQITIFLTMFAVVAGIILLCRPTLRWVDFVGATLLGVVASYSFASGLTYWPIGLLLLLCIRPPNTRTHAIYVALWLLAATLTCGLYFSGYDFTSPDASKEPPFARPLEYLAYVCTYLGNPLTSDYALLAGIVGLVVFLAAICVALRSRCAQFRDLLSYVGIALFAVANAAMTGIGRTYYGREQALSSRYVTFASLLWIANAALLYLILRAGLSRLRVGPSELSKKIYTVLAFVGLMGIVGLTVLSSVEAVPEFRRSHDFLLPAREELRQGQNLDLLRRLHAGFGLKPEGMKAIDILKNRRLSVFRDTPP